MVRGLDGFFDSLVALCGFEGHREGGISRQFPVVMARGKHLFPFRTEQLSLSAPMVLGPQGPGRVGRRRFTSRAVPSGAARRRCRVSPRAAQPPLPDDPVLAAAAAGLERVGFVGEIWDAQWRLAYLSAEYLVACSAGGPVIEDLALGHHVVAPETVEARLSWPAGPTLDGMRGELAAWGGMLIGPHAGAKDELLALSDPRLRDVLEGLEHGPMPAAGSAEMEVRFGSRTTRLDGLRMRVPDEHGRVRGLMLTENPAVRGVVLG